MPLTTDLKETITSRAAADPAFEAALREEMTHLKEDEKATIHDLLETALIKERRASATRGNSIDVNTNDL